MKKPNVVIIMADQLRADVLGKGYTPNIDRIGHEGVIFNRAYCTSPLCVPARGSFFTGRYPNETGSILNPWEPVDKKYGYVRSGIENLFGIMEQDWDSWHIGKQHFYNEDGIEKSPDAKTHWTHSGHDYRKFLKDNNKKSPGGAMFKGVLPEMAQGRITRKKTYSIPATGRYEEGFEYFFDGFFVNGAIEAMRKRDRAKPFLLNAMFLAPHPPLQIPEPWFSRVKEVNLPENVGKWGTNQSPLQLYNLTGAIGTRYSREDWEKIWPVYLGLVSLLDDCVGMIVDELKAQGIYDDTLIIFTSDHGEMLGSHCLWQKMCMYEESVRIPLYIKFPREMAFEGIQSDELVSAIDVLPTLCDCLGLNPPKGMSGVSLMPALHGKALDRDTIFIQFDGNGARGNFQRCAISGNYKLIVDIFKDETFIELYDVVHDSQELVNLAFEPEYKKLIEDMLDKLKHYMLATNDLIALPDNLYERFIADYSAFRT
ncbi:MAG: Arylsulfatase [Firmicutes bacterium ADurb.Bin193]|nr:MAG: Arylsulfatase [Firmicutes bacterium ADurb.Bin193]